MRSRGHLGPSGRWDAGTAPFSRGTDVPRPYPLKNCKLLFLSAPGHYFSLGSSLRLAKTKQTLDQKGVGEVIINNTMQSVNDLTSSVKVGKVPTLLNLLSKATVIKTVKACVHRCACLHVCDLTSMHAAIIKVCGVKLEQENKTFSLVFSTHFLDLEIRSR